MYGTGNLLESLIAIFDSILTPSKPLRTPIALNFLFILESRLSGDYKGEQTFQNRIYSLNFSICCEWFAKWKDTWSLRFQSMSWHKRLKQTEIILREKMIGKMTAPCVRWHNGGYKSQRQLASPAKIIFVKMFPPVPEFFPSDKLLEIELKLSL